MIRVDGRDLPWREGITVADVLHDLNDGYPYAVARIHGRLVVARDFKVTQVPDGTEVFLIPMIAGG
jgi:sulfur carrier protein ThiS